MSEIGEVIRGLREDRDLKQLEISKILGTSQQYYSKYETGEYDIPTHHLITLSKFYDVSMDYLVGFTRFKGRFDKLESSRSSDGIPVSLLVDRILKLNDSEISLVFEYVNFLEYRSRERETK